MTNIPDKLKYTKSIMKVVFLTVILVSLLFWLLLLSGCTTVSNCMINAEKSIDSYIEEHYHNYWK